MNGEIGTVVVVGSGHAAVEAALASRRLGLETTIVALNVAKVSSMPCNPSIGGPGKAQIVSEIDALGGEMALATDHATTSMRLLNASKGPAVQSLRAQVDKKVYAAHMRRALGEAGVRMVQGMVRDILVGKDGRACGVRLRDGRELRGDVVVLATGVYLESRVIIGEKILDSGPIGEPASHGLSASLKGLGVVMGRFKTGTSPRIKRGSISWGELSIEEGTDRPYAFSFMSKPRVWESEVCYSTYTNEATHEVIRKNVHRSPLLNGTIEGIGPRYCPSIEDKVVRFPHRARHQIYLEIECGDSDDVYLLGLSTSLPEDVQLEMVRSLPGMARAVISVPGYAIEYDYVAPSQLRPTLELKEIPGLFTAGQINGSSGYEEAAAQGLIAGINAAMTVMGKEPVVLQRDEAYIGVLIDDITRTPIREPYRMLTGRAEYRLLLRQSNADTRLTPLGRRIGLVSDERWECFRIKEGQMETARALLRKRRGGEAVWDLLRNPRYSLADFFPEIPELRDLPSGVLSEVEIEAKYQGFIERQEREARRLARYRGKAIPPGLDVARVVGLSKEGQDKLRKHSPATLGRALEIGLSPSDAMILLAYLRGGGER